MDGDDEFDFDEALKQDPLVAVDDFETAAAAEDAARRLVEHGIGASVAHVDDDRDDDDRDDDDRDDDDRDDDDRDDDGRDDGVEGDVPMGPYRVEVLTHELVRAREVLGLVEPEPRPEANPEEPMKPAPGPVPWKTVLLIWLAAMVIIPALAFFLTYQLMAR